MIFPTYWPWACSRCGSRDPNPGCHVCALAWPDDGGGLDDGSFPDPYQEPPFEDDGWEPDPPQSD